DFPPGDTATLPVWVKEGTRERLQAFQGVVTAKRNHRLNAAFTVRKMYHGVGVERAFQVHSPVVDSIKVERRGDARRAKLYFPRHRSGNSARIKEKVRSASWLAALRSLCRNAVQHHRRGPSARMGLLLCAQRSGQALRMPRY